MTAPKRPACRRCGSERARLVNSISDYRGTMRGPFCFDEYRCGQRAEQRRIARAVEALAPGRLYLPREDVLAAARGRRGRRG